MKFKLITTLFLLFIVSIQILGRDIDLDAIYVKKEFHYKKLISLKKEIYIVTKAKNLLNHTIFAHWNNNNSMVVIQEYNSTNILYLYNTITRSRKEIRRFKGTIAATLFSKDGNSILLKNIIIKEDGFPETKTIVVKIKENKNFYLDSNFPFIDAVFSQNGKFIYYHKPNTGIIKHNTIYGQTQTVIDIKKYADIIKNGDVICAFPSPNKKKYILISGSGGNYRSLLINNNKNTSLPNISSSSEIIWLNNNEFLFQKGGPINYKIFKYNLEKKKNINIAKKSLNTNLTESKKYGNYAILENQIITLFRYKKKQFKTYLEGEDVYISPDRTKFLSLYMGNLYLANIDSISKNNIKMQRILKKILALYITIYKNKSIWQSEYSKEYLQNKIATYKSLLIIK